MITRMRSWIDAWCERILARTLYDGARESRAFRLPASPVVGASPGTLARFYEDHAGQATRKWTHFPALYDRYLAQQVVPHGVV